MASRPRLVHASSSVASDGKVSTSGHVRTGTTGFRRYDSRSIDRRGIGAPSPTSSLTAMTARNRPSSAGAGSTGKLARSMPEFRSRVTHLVMSADYASARAEGNTCNKILRFSAIRC